MERQRSVQKRRYSNYFNDDGTDKNDVNAYNVSRLKNAGSIMKKKQKFYEENNFEPVKSENESDDEIFNRYGKLNDEVWTKMDNNESNKIDEKNIENTDENIEEKVEVSSDKAYFNIEKKLQLMNGFFKFIKSNSECLAKIAKYMNN